MNGLLTKIMVGGLLGLIGQIIRAALGLRELWQKSKEELSEYDTLSPRAAFYQDFSALKLVMSLLIGFAAGVLAIFTIDEETIIDPNPENGDGLDAVFGLIVAGYGGTSFIEKVFGKFLK